MPLLCKVLICVCCLFDFMQVSAELAAEFAHPGSIQQKWSMARAISQLLCNWQMCGVWWSYEPAVVKDMLTFKSLVVLRG